jgi:hypothetical protein
VYAGHGIPPVNKLDVSQNYVIGLVIFPAIIFALGIFSLAVYQCALCCRFCFHKCCPNACKCCYNKYDSQEADLGERLKYHTKARVGFFTFLALAFVADCMVFIGSTKCTQAINDLGDSMQTIANILLAIVSAVNGIASSTRTVGLAVYQAPCSSAFAYYNIQTTFSTEANNTATSIANVAGIVGTIPSNILDTRSTMLDNGPRDKDLVIYVYFASVIFFIGVFVLGYFARIKTLLTVAVVLTEFIVFTLTVVAVFEMLVVVSLIPSHCH